MIQETRMDREYKKYDPRDKNGMKYDPKPYDREYKKYDPKPYDPRDKKDREYKKYDPKPYDPRDKKDREYKKYDPKPYDREYKHPYPKPHIPIKCEITGLPIDPSSITRQGVMTGDGELVTEDQELVALIDAINNLGIQCNIGKNNENGR